LSFPHHVRSFDAFNRPLGGVERAETLHRPPPPSDASAVLLNHIVEVLNTTQLAVTRQDFELRLMD
jgi:hypothetical protein